MRIIIRLATLAAIMGIGFVYSSTGRLLWASGPTVADDLDALSNEGVSLLYYEVTPSDFDLKLAIYESGIAILAGDEYYSVFGRRGYAIIFISKSTDYYLREKLAALSEIISRPHFGVCPSSPFVYVGIQSVNDRMIGASWDGLEQMPNDPIKYVIESSKGVACEAIRVLLDQSNIIIHKEVDDEFIEYRNAAIRNTM